MHHTLRISAIITSIILLTGTLGFALSDSASAAPATKVTICHAPPGNTPNVQTITIGPVAAIVHLSLHPLDSIGSCEANPICVAGCLFTAVKACLVGDIECQKENVVAVSECVAKNCEP